MKLKCFFGRHDFDIIYDKGMKRFYKCRHCNSIFVFYWGINCGAVVSEQRGIEMLNTVKKYN